MSFFLYSFHRFLLASKIPARDNDIANVKYHASYRLSYRSNGIMLQYPLGTGPLEPSHYHPNLPFNSPFVLRHIILHESFPCYYDLHLRRRIGRNVQSIDLWHNLPQQHINQLMPLDYIQPLKCLRHNFQCKMTFTAFFPVL